MADPYRKLQELVSDCDDVIAAYSNTYHEKGRVRMMQGYVDKWDEVFGDGFFMRQLKKQVEKRQTQ